MLEELGADVAVPRSAEYDLRDPAAARAALEGAEVVIHLAARVGGIGFNRRNPAPLAYDNLMMGCNVFEQSRRLGVEQARRRLLGVRLSQVRPPVPFCEDDLWDGYPEESNAPYGLAKRMLIVLSDAYRRQYGFDSRVPVIANLYGPDDNFDLEDSHVIAAMIRKFVRGGATRASHEVVAVGHRRADPRVPVRRRRRAGARADGRAPRDLRAGQHRHRAGDAIRDLAETIAAPTGFEGEIVWDTERPDGQPRRRLDVSRATAADGVRG